MIRVRLLVMVASKHETRSPSETNYRAAAPHLVCVWALGLHLASSLQASQISQFWRFGLGKVRGTGTRVVDGIKGVVDIVEMGLGLGLGLAALRGSGALEG